MREMDLLGESFLRECGRVEHEDAVVHQRRPELRVLDRPAHRRGRPTRRVYGEVVVGVVSVVDAVVVVSVVVPVVVVVLDAVVVAAGCVVVVSDELVVEGALPPEVVVVALVVVADVVAAVVVPAAVLVGAIGLVRRPLSFSSVTICCCTAAT